MALPLFFSVEQLMDLGQVLTLNETNSKHCILVLRNTIKDCIELTDGKGTWAKAEIIDDHRKKCIVKLIELRQIPARPYPLTLGIAFTKNAARNEWLLEKVTELGVEQIVPIITQRSEKTIFKLERWESILVSALLQSQQNWLPQLQEPIAYSLWLKNRTAAADEQKLIAHCIDDSEKSGILSNLMPSKPCCALIGPEGDFTPEEIDLALEMGYKPVSLGENRLRTETAGMYMCTLFNAVNYA